MTDTQPASPAQASVAGAPSKGTRGGEPARAWRHPGWSWAVERNWLIPSGVATATLLLGAALAGIPVVVAGSLHDPQVRAQAWAFAALGAAGLAVLVLTGIVRRGRDTVLSRNGIAYLVKEQGQDWSDDDAGDFLASARRQFSRIIPVPGPGKLSGPWDWPLADGAEQWDGKVSELARSFRALHLALRSDDGSAPPAGLFIWAWWAVTVALTARLTAADRGLGLDVWQRPSRARAGQLVPAPWSQRPHRFGGSKAVAALATVLPGTVPQEYVWPVELTVVPRDLRDRHGRKGTPAAKLSVLLVRLSRHTWGPLPGSPAGPDPAKVTGLVLHDAAGLGDSGMAAGELHELRIEPPDGSTQFPWPAFPSLVAEISGWIRRKAAELEGQTLLLGTVIPPEVAAGLGVNAGQAAQAGWPAHLWPIVYQVRHDSLVIPALDLGAAAFTGTGGR